MVAMNKWQDITDMEVNKGAYLFDETVNQNLKRYVGQSLWTYSRNTAGRF